MKILITSVDALIDEQNNQFYPGIINALDVFKALDEANEVVVVSIHRERLNLIPERFNPIPVSIQARRVDLITQILKDNPQFTYSDVVVLGAKNDDLYLAAHERVPLLTAGYSKIDPQIIQRYGITIRDSQALTDFCRNFLNIQNPWYYRLKVDDRTTMYSLTKAGDYQPADMATLFNHFQSCLKHGNRKYLELFKTYFLMSCYSQATVKEFREVDYWGVYPSSNVGLNHDLEYFKELARTSFGGKPRPSRRTQNEDRQLLIRTEATTKRHFTIKQVRLTQGCEDQLRTIRINPKYQDQLRNATVCIIDDFTTYGTSCETTRLLMQQVGVKKLLFVTMGKFGQEYYRYVYNLKGDVFTAVTPIRLNGPTSLNGGIINPNATQEVLESLSVLL